MKSVDVHDLVFVVRILLVVVFVQLYVLNIYLSNTIA